MLQNSANIKEKKRHGCLTVWLVFIIIISLISIIIVIPKGSPVIPDTLPGWQVAVSILLSLFNIVCAVALFMWKKWGFWLFCASAVINFIINITIGELVIIALVVIAVQILVLILALNTGREDKGWPQLE